MKKLLPNLCLLAICGKRSINVDNLFLHSHYKYSRVSSKQGLHIKLILYIIF